MPFQVTKVAVKLREKASDGAANPAGLVLMKDVVTKLEDVGDGWWRVGVSSPGAPPREGFIRAELLREVADTTPPADIDKARFFEVLTHAAQARGSNRNYLYALAFVETAVRNIPAKGSSAFGPFQFMPDTWRDLVVRFGTETGIGDADIARPEAQAVFAAIFSNANQKALTEALGRVPNSIELYLAHLLGPQAAIAATRGVDPANPVDRALRVFYRATPKGEAFVDRILDANASLLKDGDQARSLKAVSDEIASRLRPGLAEAASLAPADDVRTLPGEPAGEPPWLVVARAELAKPVLEDKAGSNPEVEKYFTATGFGPARDDVSWCAAFVSWCMANCGNAGVAAQNRRSARAADWTSWGFSVGRPVVGAVGVTHPLVEGSSGHVGFVTGASDAGIVLLAGNQRNGAGQESVCERTFSPDSFVQFRFADVT